jgi:hypothetical protein
MATNERPVANATIGVRVTAAEKAQLAEEAAAEGVTLSTLLYRRAMNKPDARRPQGKRPKDDPQADQPIDGLTERFQMTG